jgi:hypothetical protein
MPKILVVLIFLSSSVLWAQAPIGSHSSLPIDPMAERRMEQDAFESWALNRDANERKAETARETVANLEFYAKARQFVDLWETFAAELNSKKTFNAKLAKEISKAFHDMEKSDGWPVGKKK